MLPTETLKKSETLSKRCWEERSLKITIVKQSKNIMYVRSSFDSRNVFYF